jgi:Sulfotransferase domain
MIVARKAKTRVCPRIVQIAVLLVAILLGLYIAFPQLPEASSSIVLLTIPPTTEADTTERGDVKGLIDARSEQIAKTKLIPGNFPHLSSLIEVDSTFSTSSQGEEAKVPLRLVGDVQFLLDYAIVGFSKCGTTTLLKWIRRDPDVLTFKREIHELVNDNPGRLVERLYQNILDNPNSTSNTNQPKTFLQGFKNPEILQVPKALQHMHAYWPETKLIISVRNPLKWFRSFYNFRLTIGHLKQVGSDPNMLIGHCDNGGKILCTHMGAFHVKLFRLGKTDMSSSDELELLKPYLDDSDQDILDHVIHQHDMQPQQSTTDVSIIPKMKNKVFFMDLRQLSDSNHTRSKIFRQDLQRFLGLRHDLTPVFRARPFKQLELTLDKESKRHQIQSICDRKYLPLQQELYPMAQKASVWIRNYFLKSADVVVSSPDYVEELLETWMHNPCDSDLSGLASKTKP